MAYTVKTPVLTEFMTMLSIIRHVAPVSICPYRPGRKPHRYSANYTNYSKTLTRLYSIKVSFITDAVSGNSYLLT